MNTKNLKIMKKASFYLVVMVILLAGCKEHKLMINGRPGYQIVISNKADSIEKRAAQQLQHYLMKMSKAKLPVVEMLGWSNDLRSATAGRGNSNLVDQMFERLPSELQDKIKNQIVSRKGLSAGELGA